MGSSEKGVNIQFSDKALTFIKTRRLNSPLVLVNMGFRTGGGRLKRLWRWWVQWR